MGKENGASLTYTAGDLKGQTRCPVIRPWHTWIFKIFHVVLGNSMLHKFPGRAHTETSKDLIACPVINKLDSLD